MAGLVDSDALILDLRGRLQERSSWGLPQLHALIAELEQKHRIDESADAAVIRRFGAHLQDSFLGILPAATPDPLPADDRLATSAVMDGGATFDPPLEDACHPYPPRRPAPAMT